jgi:DNA/RNA-binding domain of Phe-tRNA-synthetase-like protein
MNNANSPTIGELKLDLDIDSVLKSKFPSLRTLVIKIMDVKVEKKKQELEDFKLEVIGRTKNKWDINQLREHKVFRAYRDFFWRIGVDPTKTRPASEALIRRVLRDRPLPNINTLVDAYNLASIDTTIPLAAFDDDGLKGELRMREAHEGEAFLGIGMKKPHILNGGEAVVEDNEKLVAIYPYRDADSCKITTSTSKVQLLVCGVPNIDKHILEEAGGVSMDYIKKFCTD